MPKTIAQIGDSMNPSGAPTTRERLITATTDVIVERGWGGVSTRVVAERASVNPGVVHYHFGSIDELRRQAVAAALDALFEGIMEAARSLTPRQVLAASAQVVAEIQAQQMQLFLEAIPATSRDPRLREWLDHLLARYRAVLAERIRTHHPHATVDPDLMAALIAASLDGLLLHHLVDPELDVAAHVEPLLALLGPEE